MQRFFPKRKSRTSLDNSDKKFNISKSSSDIDLKKLRDCHIYVVKDSFRKNGAKFKFEDVYSEKMPEKFSPTSANDSRVRLRSKTENTRENDTTNHRQTIYDEGEYVVLDFHQAGRRDNLEKTYLSENDQISEKATINQDQLFDTANIDEYVTLDFENPSQTNVDECGYEVPLACLAPTYMSLDFKTELPPERSPPEPPSNIHIKLSCEQSTSADHEIDFSCESSNKSPRSHQQIWKKDPISDRKKVNEPSYQDKPPSKATMNVKTNLPNVDDSETNLGKDFQNKDIIGNTEDVVKPRPSFLQSRLETIGPDAQSVGENEFREIKSSSTTLSSSFTALSSSFTDQESKFDSDEWTDYSDSSSDQESYYAEVSPPDLTELSNDHDYAVIVDPVHNKLTKKKSNRNRSYGKVKNFINGRSQSTESSKSTNDKSNATPKLHRQTMQDIKTSLDSGQTWEAVSTPAIFKMDNFKDLKPNNTESSNFNQHSSNLQPG